jgi:hypothetical protein
VSWATTMDNVEKYDVNYKPTNARYVWVYNTKFLYCVLSDFTVIFVYNFCVLLFSFIFLLPVLCPVFITHSSTYCTSFLPFTRCHSFIHPSIHSYTGKE